MTKQFWWFWVIAAFWTSTNAAHGDDGDWFIRAGANGFWSSNIQHPACKQPGERGAPDCLAFTCQDDWTRIANGNYVRTSNTVAAHGPRILEVARAGHALRWL